MNKKDRTVLGNLLHRVLGYTPGAHSGTAPLHINSTEEKWTAAFTANLRLICQRLWDGKCLYCADNMMDIVAEAADMGSYSAVGSMILTCPACTNEFAVSAARVFELAYPDSYLLGGDQYD